MATTGEYVFISSSSRDKELTERLVTLLESNGISTWSDLSSPTLGEALKTQFQDAIRNSAAVITLATPNYLSSEWFHSQANFALGLGKQLIPVVSDDLDASRLPSWISDLLYVRFPSEQDKLVESIVVILGKTDDSNTRNKRVPRQKKTTETPAKKQSVVQSAPPSSRQEHPTTMNLPVAEDKTPFHKDTPSDIDYLGRLGFVEALAQWINRNWDEYKNVDKSFVINIHGQWGAGKTTFLNLLQQELQKQSEPQMQNKSQGQNGLKTTADGQWIVVWFNAWENRHIKPEWWPVLDKIYRASLSQKKEKKERIWHIKLQEWWWRFYSGRKLELLGLLASSLLLAFIIYWVMRPTSSADQDFMQRIEAVAKPIGLVLSAVTTIFLGTKLVSQALISSGSAKAAEIYLQFTPDPIDNIKQHFDRLIDKRINKPVIVFIDDLDRCDRTYLVGLLETIQTLLNHRKVFYVIAADQRWLFAAFEETYKEFKESIKEPGKKIGYLFLEKIFQLSMSIPSISDEARKIYLDHLLGGEKKEQMEENVRK